MGPLVSELVRSTSNCSFVLFCFLQKHNVFFLFVFFRYFRQELYHHEVLHWPLYYRLNQFGNFEIHNHKQMLHLWTLQHTVCPRYQIHHTFVHTCACLCAFIDASEMGTILNIPPDSWNGLCQRNKSEIPKKGSVREMTTTEMVMPEDKICVCECVLSVLSSDLFS